MVGLDSLRTPNRPTGRSTEDVRNSRSTFPWEIRSTKRSRRRLVDSLDLRVLRPVSPLGRNGHQHQETGCPASQVMVNSPMEATRWPPGFTAINTGVGAGTLNTCHVPADPGSKAMTSPPTRTRASGPTTLATARPRTARRPTRRTKSSSNPSPVPFTSCSWGAFGHCVSRRDRYLTRRSAGSCPCGALPVEQRYPGPGPVRVSPVGQRLIEPTHAAADARTVLERADSPRPAAHTLDEPDSVRSAERFAARPRHVPAGTAHRACGAGSGPRDPPPARRADRTGRAAGLVKSREVLDG